MEEIYKDIKGYEGHYMVSNKGNIKSVQRKCKFMNSTRILPDKILKPSKDKNGYFRVGLNKNGKTKIRTIHQLVAIEFLNHIPNGHLIHVDHIDGNESNNNINNLQILTAREHVTKTFLGKKTSSKYTGVSLNKASNKFQARIVINGKAIHLGVFKNEHDAHLAYQNALKQL